MIALIGAVKHPNIQHPIAPPSPNAFPISFYVASLFYRRENFKYQVIKKRY